MRTCALRFITVLTVTSELLSSSPDLAAADATFTVNSAAIAGDAAPGDGACDDGNGVCSLRGAIVEANALPGKDTVVFNIPPGGVQTITITGGGIGDLPTITDPIVIDGSSQSGSGDQGIVINADNDSDVIHITAGNSRIRGLVIHSANGDAILIEQNGNNTIEDNFLGTDATGTVDLGNGRGVEIDNVPNNTVKDNLISANIFGGVEIIHAGATQNLVSGNRIGTDVTGTMRLGGSLRIEDASGNGVSGNLICPTAFGVEINARLGEAKDNVLAGNLIGTDITGTVAIDGCSAGVSISGSGNLIGGPTPAHRNVIVEANIGIRIAGGDDNLVQGNYIGTDITGSAALPNLFFGIELSDATGNVIGGSAPGEGNLISGNGFNDEGEVTGGGVRVLHDSFDNFIRGNLIGTDASGLEPLPNGLGILFDFGASGNTIGGTGSGAGNTIAFSELMAIWVPENPNGNPVGNSFFRNSIHGNGFGIDLGDPGVTPNDAGDADLGGNLRQNAPVLDGAGPAGGGTYVTGSLDSTPEDTFRIEFFSNPACHSLGRGEGKTFLGATTFVTDGAGHADFALIAPEAAAPGSAATATATNMATGDTSEFSPCQEVVNEADLETTKTTDPAEVTPGGTIRYTVTVANSTGPAEAVGVQIADPLPAETTLVSGSLDDDPACAFDSGLNQVECSPGTLLPTESFQFDFEVLVSDDALVPSFVTNVATAGSATPDPDTSNNQGQVTTKVDCDVVGTSGNDVLKIGPGDVSVCGLAGNDHLKGADGEEVLVGGLGDDILVGNLGNDLLIGGSGDDHLLGQAGDDVLRGGSGNDFLFGGPDFDELDGGPDSDSCKPQGGGGITVGCET